jgi:exopolyphosphatase/guanosine-5'-triphosphate,3'-diphosphate pyrophosphatase
MIFSTIDIGTNTILMVTCSVDEDGRITILGDEHEIARLGKGVDASRTIMPETFDRVAVYLNGYVDTARSLGSERIIAFGTSALRDARNREEFIMAMFARTGIHIEILSGKDEAELTYRGAFFGLDLHARHRGVIDIGGGSTEIASGGTKHPHRSISLDIGAVRITERFFPELPPSNAQLASARTFVRDALAQAFDLPGETVVVGVAGTVTTLGAISIGQTDFKAEALNSVHLAAEKISEITAHLATLTQAQTASTPGVHPGRADVLLGGAIVLDEFMRRYTLEEIIVSTRGVRYGVMMREIERVRS